MCVGGASAHDALRVVRPGVGIELAPLTQAQWNLPLPLPMVPQFAGIETARQSFCSPTAGPLGYDLRNGVWARRGQQSSSAGDGARRASRAAQVGGRTSRGVGGMCLRATTPAQLDWLESDAGKLPLVCVTRSGTRLGWAPLHEVAPDEGAAESS